MPSRCVWQRNDTFCGSTVCKTEGEMGAGHYVGKPNRLRSQALPRRQTHCCVTHYFLRWLCFRTQPCRWICSSIFQNLQPSPACCQQLAACGADYGAYKQCYNEPELLLDWTVSPRFVQLCEEQGVKVGTCCCCCCWSAWSKRAYIFMLC